MEIKNVLLTGTAGYIGSVLTKHLLNKGYNVWGLDSLMFGGQALREFLQYPNYRFIQGDIRDLTTYKSTLNEVHAVIHLAAIVSASACSKNPDLASQTNWIATKQLFDHANRADNIKRFIFPSSTSVYGAVKGNGFVNEMSATNPLSLYAETKLKCEEYLLRARTRADFVPTVFRFPTAYGLSPRMRFDLTVNEFARDLTVGRELQIFGSQFWRPYCHVDDLARACIRVLEVDESLVDHELYCVGDNKDNYTKRMIYDVVAEVIPDPKVSFAEKLEDPRDYRVDFSKIKRIGFEITKTLKDGVREIYQALKSGLIPNPYDPIYSN